jgi:membrane-associated protein
VTTHSLAATAVLGIKWLDPNFLVGSLGGWVVPMVAIIIFAECGILLGFLLPGDTLLFPLGLFIARGVVATPLWLAVLIMAACAVLGNVVGYLIGYVVGPRLFNKSDSRLFKREYVDRTHEFFERYGVAAILLGRFVPVIRTFVTAVAGVARMSPAKYLSVSLIGGVLWAGGIVIAGYFLGRIDFIGSHIDLILSLIVVISVVPVVIEWARHRKERKLAADVTQPIPVARH